MKTVKFFLGALALAAVSAFAAPQANAADENRDENGKIVRGPYLTNGLWDNWFVSAGVGANFFYDDSNWGTGFAFDVNVGKWFTPEWGARVGGNGISKGNNDKFGYIHADAMWNISNTIGGYKPSRIWNFVPYAHYGLMVDNGKEIAGGFGLYNIINVRSWNRVDFFLDVRGTIYRQSGPAGMISANVGVNVDLGKNTWVRASQYSNPSDVDKLSASEAAVVALTAANAALLDEKKNLEAEKVQAVQKQEELVQEVKKTAEEAGLKEVGPASFYFEIGQTTLSQKELAHLDFYMKNVLPNVKNGKATVVTGTADSNTGYAKRNEYLSKKRAEYVIDLLKTKYGIDTANIVVKNQVIKAAANKAALDRAVVVSFE